MKTASVRVAVIQAAPVFFDRDATVARVSELTAEAAGNDARLILFPEAFIPAYPRAELRSCCRQPDAGRTPAVGALLGQLGACARSDDRGAWRDGAPGAGHLAVGVIEQEGKFGRGTLYCTLLYFGPDGALLGRHRKLMPTAAERVIWGQGDGSTLTVLDTEIGRIGGLICWENYMPLARMALYAKGVQIYLAPTADARETWQGTLRHIACEGRCFVLGCNQFVAKSHLPASLEGLEELASAPETLCRGGSAIISPLGDVLAGPLYDREGILYADLDLEQVIAGKFDLDVAGHYARPDVFRLAVDERPQPSVVWTRND